MLSTGFRSYDTPGVRLLELAGDKRCRASTGWLRKNPRRWALGVLRRHHQMGYMQSFIINLKSYQGWVDAMFSNLHTGELPLLNVSFKIFTKIGTDCVTEIAHEVVTPMQSTFIPGRHILEGSSSPWNYPWRNWTGFCLRLILKRRIIKCGDHLLSKIWA
jgi:hypothetical protein